VLIELIALDICSDNLQFVYISKSRQEVNVRREKQRYEIPWKKGTDIWISYANSDDWHI
jgi:hypothetical protein